jgi:hypothetical protein
MIPVIVCTVHRGVFFGYVDPSVVDNKLLRLERAKCAIYWATKKGIGELALDGPNPESSIGAEMPYIVLHDVTAVIGVTPQAEEKWISA